MFISIIIYIIQQFKILFQKLFGILGIQSIQSLLHLHTYYKSFKKNSTRSLLTDKFGIQIILRFQNIYFYMNRPVALVCYICGRQFGTKSLPIHLKACQKKWENQENLKPPKQRRPCPRPPKGFQQMASKGNITKQDIHKFNAKSYDAFVEQALVQCEYCGRKFNQKSLVPHQKACKTHPMIRKPYVNKGPLGKVSDVDQPINNKGYNFNQKMENYGQSNQGNLVPCRRCGRKFNSDRVSKHQGVCKGDKFQAKNIQKNEYQNPQKQNKNMKPNFDIGKKPKWKIQHEQLQNAMREMRKLKAYEAKGGKLSDLPPPQRSNYDHYVQCRYCGRKYAPDVAQRHIPKCANIVNKPGGIKPSKIQQKYISGTGSGTNKPISNSSNYYPIKPNLVVSSKSNLVSDSNMYPSKVSNQINQNYKNKAQENPFSKLSTNKNLKVVQSYPINSGSKNNGLKPTLRGKDSSNKYW